VPFCGHATIATAIAHAERHGPGALLLQTRSGTVEVTTRTEKGRLLATLTSVAPHVSPVAETDLAEAMAALRWSTADLDPDLPPRVAYAGAHHLVLAAQTRARLAELDYDFPRLQTLSNRCDWTTVHLIHGAASDLFDARDPFPVGGVYEDPATGAAAAALGAYLPSVAALNPPARLTIRQGEDMGRPSTLLVDIPASPDQGISVTGTAVPLHA
jgi:PhzF family phenazine biosynthesis protein